MATTGTVCIAAFPLATGATTSYSPAGVTASSFTAPVKSGTLTINGISTTVTPYQQGPSDILLNLTDSGIGATINSQGYLVLTGSSPTVAGAATILTCLGLTAT